MKMAIGYRLSAIGYRLSAIGYRLSAIGYYYSCKYLRRKAPADHPPEPPRTRGGTNALFLAMR